ncbi:MAG: hypothetical protein JWQ81_7351 [Amycolatopsis sp.]|jgi:hypothetical protein|uniref:hypothetical protein n=1 Tax=Amycolatopsis sp. TaxID=37632 RepID=UPI00260327A0|nr:hypothetical protein [Amycolatopsis sp.]MCU1686612.1 hypothetical protein [Amycolatopsis sp.]
MRNTKKIRVALTAAVVVLGLSAAGTGVALASSDPAPAPAPAPAAQAAPNTGTDSGQVSGTDASLAQMDQMMQQMVQNLPADQRATAIAMHQQMRPAMQKMMSGEKDTMDG